MMLFLCSTHDPRSAATGENVWQQMAIQKIIQAPLFIQNQDLFYDIRKDTKLR
jgi:hypothetical protein